MQLLEDTDQLVRRDAIIALGNLEYEWGGARNDIQLPADMLQRFAERYDVEPSPIVRAELAKAFAFVPNRSPLQESSLLKALNDNAPGVLQHAVSGVAKLRIGSALQRLIQLLGHENRAVRLSVATALAEYGSEARSYLPSINSAIAVENDPTVRKALESAIARVGQ